METKRKSLSIIKLYKIAFKFYKSNPKVNVFEIGEFLEYINKHKDDNL